MAPWILFDVLLAGMLVLIVPIGFWRGGLKEAVLTGSILAGAALGNAFAVRWGPNMADLLGVRDAVGTTVLAGVLLWGCVIVLGYAAGAAIGQVSIGLVGRLAGALLGLFNGLLLLGFTLRFINILLLNQEPDSWTEGGYIAGVLSRGTEELLLLAVAVMSIGVIAGLLARLAGAWTPENDLVAAGGHQPTVHPTWPATPPTPRLAYDRHGAEAVKMEPDEPPLDPLRDFGLSSTWMRRAAPGSTNDRNGPAHLDEGPIRHTSDADRAPGRFEPPVHSRDITSQPPPDSPPDGASVVSEWLRRGSRPTGPHDGTNGAGDVPPSGKTT